MPLIAKSMNWKHSLKHGEFFYSSMSTTTPMAYSKSTTRLRGTVPSPFATAESIVLNFLYDKVEQKRDAQQPCRTPRKKTSCGGT